MVFGVGEESRLQNKFSELMPGKIFGSNYRKSQTPAKYRLFELSPPPRNTSEFVGPLIFAVPPYYEGTVCSKLPNMLTRYS